MQIAFKNSSASGKLRCYLLAVVTIQVHLLLLCSSNICQCRIAEAHSTDGDYVVFHVYLEGRLNSNAWKMGKKVGWISALKRVFTPTPKDKPLNRPENKNVKEKTKWDRGKFKDGETTSFFPVHREPSSIEKILGDAEREIRRKPSPPPTRILPPPNRTYNPKTSSSSRPIRPTRNRLHASATKIQATYRGHMVRKNYKCLKGMERLQDVMRSQRVKRQTVNAMRCMQLLVRVQTQVHSRRIQRMENKRLQPYSPRMSEKDMESTFSKWFTHQSEVEKQNEWDYSRLTQEEIDARMRRKLEAVLKRERALVYAHSRQQLQYTPKSSVGTPMWWNWLEKHFVDEPTPPPPTQTPNQSLTNFFKTKNSNLNKGRRQRNMRDDESLTSCPAFAGKPSYMAPTASAMAKVKVLGREEEKTKKKKKRFGFGFGFGFGGTESVTTTPVVGRHRSMRSIGSMSLDSSASVPVGFGRNRFGY